MTEGTPSPGAPAGPAPAPETPTTSPEPKKDTIPEPKVLYYILSFFISIFGIIFGAIYMSKGKEDMEMKKFGKICLLLGLIPMICYCLCCGVYYALVLTGSIAGGIGDMSTY
ncbi:MAG: hypothetical protein HQ530_01100 [Parcubacteria group bacterium]|nr:hypothetical protein [Parcubacteria group bacterium]